jgi:hypothetical protein
VIFSIKGTKRLQNIIAYDTPSGAALDVDNIRNVPVNNPKQIPYIILPLGVIGDVT